MKRRFTPVHLTAVQTVVSQSNQGERESVEQFAQNLRKLFKIRKKGGRGGISRIFTKRGSIES